VKNILLCVERSFQKIMKGGVMLTVRMKTLIINRNACVYRQALSSFLDRGIQTPLQGFHSEDDVMTIEHVSQEADRIASISSIFPLTYTPPR
jgi:hypothetical protein